MIDLDEPVSSLYILVHGQLINQSKFAFFIIKEKGGHVKVKN